MHSVWVDCTAGNLLRCIAVKPYLQPGNNSTTPNRYTYFLFRQTGKVTVLGESAAHMAASDIVRQPPSVVSLAPFMEFDIGAFLAENEGVLTPVAVNFMHVQGPWQPGTFPW